MRLRTCVCRCVCEGAGLRVCVGVYWHVYVCLCVCFIRDCVILHFLAIFENICSNFGYYIHLDNC